MIEFENVSYSYGRGEVLKNISMSIRPHTITAIIGRNGCGKSTLVSCISGQLNYLGKITVGGREIKSMSSNERARMISILPQFLSSPDVTVRELVSYGRYPYLGWQKRLDKADWQMVDKAIKDTQLDKLSNVSVKSLSGGEKQRAFFAMILAGDSRIVVLDEPTTYMDIDRQKQLMDFIAELKRRKKTVIIVMHDISAALEYSDTVAVIDEGITVGFGDSDSILESRVLERVFNRRQIIFERDSKRFVFFE